MTFHAEAAADAVGLARRLRQIGARAGLALKPGTQVRDYLELAVEFDQILVMTVEPGFGGQSFMADMMPKLVALREVVARSGLDIWLQVDGGSPRRRSPSPRRPAQTPSSPGRASSGRTTRRSRSRPSVPPPSATRTVLPPQGTMRTSGNGWIEP